MSQVLSEEFRQGDFWLSNTLSSMVSSMIGHSCTEHPSVVSIFSPFSHCRSSPAGKVQSMGLYREKSEQHHVEFSYLGSGYGLLLVLSSLGLGLCPVPADSVGPPEGLAEIFPRQRSVDVHAAAVLPLEALLSLGKAFLPLPQFHPVLDVDGAIDLLHGLVILDVSVGCHTDGLALLRDLNKCKTVNNESRGPCSATKISRSGFLN